MLTALPSLFVISPFCSNHAQWHFSTAKRFFPFHPAQDRDCELAFSISVNDGTFHPTQRGVDLLDAEEYSYPEREARKRDQFA